MKKMMHRAISTIAKDNGYSDSFDLLRDYGFIPTVLTPKHRKSEIMKLLFQHIRNECQKKERSTL